MWEARTVDYFTREPTGDWEPTTELYFWYNMGAEWRRDGCTRQEVIDQCKNQPGRVFEAKFKEFRYKGE